MNQNLKHISSQELELKLKKLVTTERKILHSILECINEVDLRKLHLSHGYPSLFDYLTKAIGYTPASAMRRIDAARLIRQIPEVSKKIESGEINLSQMSILQKTIREVEKSTHTKVEIETKKDLINKILKTNTQQTEVILAQTFNLTPPQVTHNHGLIKTQTHQDESQSLTLYFTKEEIEILTQARNLVSHAIKTNSLKQALVYLAKKEVQKRTNYKIKTAPQSQITSETEVEQSVTSSILNMTNTLTVPDKISNISPHRYRKTLIKPGACCEYTHTKSQKKCGATQFLTVDHIQPIWAGGKNTKDNLRVLCANHNKFRYQIQIGQYCKK